MTLKVLMLPHMKHFRTEESGIKRVVEAYHRHLPAFGIELVDPDATTYDVKVAHAGMAGTDCTVSMLHGLYWTGDYDAAAWEWKANESVIASIRGAREVVVPSEWVAETLRRDMHLNPHVIGHGIDWREWQHKEESRGYVLWNKNRAADVCSPVPMAQLARRAPSVTFVSTFGTPDAPDNVQVCGLLPHREMKLAVQRAAVYLSTTKETFGIGVLEAMAAGVPVLGFRHGGNVDLIEHGVNGYLARPGDMDDLAAGLDYCLKHRAVLGRNGQTLAQRWTWEKVAEEVAQVFRLAAESEPATVSVVIPVYNKSPEQLSRAIESALAQTYTVEEIIVVDDGSENDKDLAEVADAYPLVRYLHKTNEGVAHARNDGIARVYSKYVCCLDADDWLDPRFLEACIAPLEEDHTLGVAYTRLMAHLPDGTSRISEWPGRYDYDQQLRRRNQIPTCAVFRREAWERSGGYRQRYAPTGAGAEDAAFWTHLGALGYGAILATEEPLFHYSAGTGHTARRDYREPDWLGWFPWAHDGQHPFASVARPKRMSHPVRQYDEPVVSVIIPVGPNHQRLLVDALDSLEAQTFRKWEAIVVFDGGNEWLPEIHNAYPFIWHTHTQGKGAGHARNVGAAMARAPFLLFLDADDWLQPTALDRMLEAWNEHQSAVYSDYYGVATVNDVEALDEVLRRSITERNERTGETTISYRAAEYDCPRAQAQPENPPYLWCNVTTLLPKAWHDQIGGFDEAMPSWEDVDYWYRLARAGRCFVRVAQPLMTYRFSTGTRRENGRQQWDNLINYMQSKYRKEPAMSCSGCSQRRSTPAPAPPTSQPRSVGVIESLGDEEWSMHRLVDGNRGDHLIVGWVTKTRYGHKADGDVFLVHRADVAAEPDKFERVYEGGVALPDSPVEETPEPVLVALVEPETLTVEPVEETPKRKARKTTK